VALEHDWALASCQTGQLRLLLPLLEQPPDHTAVRPLLTVSVTDVPEGKTPLPVLPTFTRSPLGDEVMYSPERPVACTVSVDVLVWLRTLATPPPPQVSEELHEPRVSVPPQPSVRVPQAAGVRGRGPTRARPPLPRKPYKGQKRPPCTPWVEVKINGGCWVPHLLKAPCPEELFAYQGQCYTTAMLAPPTPQSLGE